MKFILLLSLLSLACGGNRPLVPLPVPPPLPIEQPIPVLEWQCKSWSEVVACPTSAEISPYFLKALADINKLRTVNPEYGEDFFKAATEIIFRKIEGCNERGCGFYDEYGVLAHGSFNPFVAPWRLEIVTLETLQHEFLHEIWYMNWGNETCADGVTRVWGEGGIGHGGECDPLNQ